MNCCFLALGHAWGPYIYGDPASGVPPTHSGCLSCSDRRLRLRPRARAQTFKRGGGGGAVGTAQPHTPPRPAAVEPHRQVARASGATRKPPGAHRRATGAVVPRQPRCGRCTGACTAPACWPWECVRWGCACEDSRPAIQQAQLEADWTARFITPHCAELDGKMEFHELLEHLTEWSPQELAKHVRAVLWPWRNRPCVTSWITALALFRRPRRCCQISQASCLMTSRGLLGLYHNRCA